MPLKKNTKKAVYIFAVFFVLFTTVFLLRNFYSKSETISGNNKEVLTITHNIDVVSSISKQWKYHTGDNAIWVSPSFNDSAWLPINPKLNLDSVSADLFNSVIWFRRYFSIDTSLINKILALSVTHYGASEIYMDGKLLKKYGTVSADLMLEKTTIPEFPIIFSLPDTNKHLLLVRYSNHNALLYYKKYDENLGGFKLDLIPNAYKAISEKKENDTTVFIILLLFGFFLTLSFVHFLLYVFYRKQKANLYYSLFVFVFSLVVLKPYLPSAIHNPSIYLFYDYYSILPPIFLLYSLVICLYTLFKPNHIKTLFIIGNVITLITLATSYYTPLEDYNGMAWVALIIFTCIESVRAVFTGVLRKQEGAKIIAVGVVVFFIFVVLAILTAFITNSNVSVNIVGFKGILIFLLIMLALISIPLSMSIYLARNFAFTNKHLQDKLLEIENLSAKSILQEKEKQQILSSQNEMLEMQVTERTYEIVKQKEIIEERNKDITDSIHYARRIQHALLASDNLLKKNLADYFIFFNPKDIVSGDFYWATCVNDVFYLVIADSTGHGVPGAFMSLLNMSFLNEAITEKKIQKPNEILAYVRNRLIDSLKADGSEEGGKDGMDCTLIAFQIKTKIIEFSCANNPLILLRNNELVEYPSDRMPVGKSPRENEPFTLQTIQLQADDTVYMFTDGYADQFGGPKGKKFKYKQLEELLLANNRLSMQEQKTILGRQFDTWKGELEQVDDVTLFAFNV